MKRLFTLLAALLLTASVFAQSPQKMSYQAVVRNSSNQLVVNHAVGMKVSILQGSASGTEVYKEIYNPNLYTNANGLVTVEIGGGVAVVGTFEGIDWANGPFFIKTETDPTGGTSYSIVGTSELLSVPYALYSLNGTPGPQGLAGIDGIDGIDGEKGEKGEKGDQGEIGTTGPKGDKGDTGDTGDQGIQGIQGPAGTNGVDGAKGDKGEQGIQGPAGVNGTNGVDGAKGDKGDKGDKGEQGIQGIQGPAGVNGTNGVDGAKGDKGDKGEQGIQGIQGPAGADGLTTSVNSIVQVGGNIDLTTADIAASTDKNYVTDDQLTEVSHTNRTSLDLVSGTNTGDQDLSSFATKNMANQNITNLADPVNDQDAATKVYVDKLMDRIKFLEGILQDSGFIRESVTDIDGNTYQTVKLGNLIWMTENLRVTHFPDGSAIQLVEDAAEWSALTTYDEAYCWYDNDIANKETKGGLYTWYTAASGRGQGVCPEGWHLPNSSDWWELISYLISYGYNWNGSLSGNKIAKSLSSKNGWNPSSEIGDVGNDQQSNNSTGYNALPVGFRSSYGGFFKVDEETRFWGEFHSVGSAGGYELNYSEEDFSVLSHDIMDGYSVRCVKASGTAAAPEAGFSISTSNITEGERVVFTDISSNTPTSWEWDFGDGLTSTQRNPVHIYLSAGTYSITLKVTNSSGTDTETKSDFISVQNGSTASVTDFDGNEYQTIRVGNQVWMAENLKVTHFQDGTEIPFIEGLTGWSSLTVSDKAYCWYNDEIANKDSYGGLYSWPAVMNGAAASAANPSGVQGICPNGWHVPSDAEWKEFEMYLGMHQADADAAGARGNEGTKMKATSGWNSSSWATNESGFTALPGGKRFNSSYDFSGLGYFANFWSTTEGDDSNIWTRSLGYMDWEINRYTTDKNDGLSIRCIQD